MTISMIYNDTARASDSLSWQSGATVCVVFDGDVFALAAAVASLSDARGVSVDSTDVCVPARRGGEGELPGGGGALRLGVGEPPGVAASATAAGMPAGAAGSVVGVGSSDPAP